MKVLKKIKEDIELRLAEILNNQLLLHQSNKIITENIGDFIRLSSGGKRVRGTLVSVGAGLTGDTNPNYLDLAVAVELMQTSILIHDDIIDCADTRRGEITIHTKYQDLGLAKAICVGDYGFFLTYQIINGLEIDDKKKNYINQIFSNMMYNTVVGEIMDVELPHQISPTRDELTSIYVNKTAWYTIIGPLLMGAALNNIDHKLNDQIIELGTSIGIAFQIKDDIISIMSSDNGKCNSSDIKEGKITEMYLYIKDTHPEELKFYGDKNSTPAQISDIKQLFIDTKAVFYAEQQALKHTNQALSLLAKMNIKEDSKELLKTIINGLLSRNK